MISRVIASALWAQVERVRWTHQKAVWIEAIRLVPSVRVMVGAVEIEQHPGARFDSLATPFERLPGEAADHGEERVEAPHLLHEAADIRVVVARGDALATFRM